MTTQELDPEIMALIDEVYGPRPKPPKPKLVVSHDRLVRDADVPVHPTDPNAGAAVDGVVSVRRPEPEWLRLGPGTVRINMQEAEYQWHERQHAVQRDRQQRRDIDPFNT